MVAVQGEGEPCPVVCMRALEPVTHHCATAWEQRAEGEIGRLLHLAKASGMCWRDRFGMMIGC